MPTRFRRDTMLMSRLHEKDPDKYVTKVNAVKRSENGVELIPSENFVSRSMLEVMSSVFTNK